MIFGVVNILFKSLRAIKLKLRKLFNLVFNSVTQFKPIIHFYTPWKREKTTSFLLFSDGIEMEHWLKMG